MTYDTSCYDLAKRFLADYEVASLQDRERLTDQLACVIQQAIEDFLDDAALAAVKQKADDVGRKVG